MWMRFSGALLKKRSSEMSYREIVKNSSNEETLSAKQIEKDLLRTMPSNACFCNMNSVGVPRLRRILRGLAWLYPDIGYCQGTGMSSASIFNLLSDLPSGLGDPSVLLGESMRVAGSLADPLIDSQRRKHLAYIIAEQGQPANQHAAVAAAAHNTNLSKVRPGLRLGTDSPS
ncbi:UNVERIFIED_CONTAM: hypothetical protein FKN15_018681 [Acipenser sinensis]